MKPDSASYQFLIMILDSTKLKILDSAIDLTFLELKDVAFIGKKSLLLNKGIKLITNLKLISKRELQFFMNECHNVNNDFGSKEEKEIEILIQKNPEVKDYLKGFISYSIST